MYLSKRHIKIAAEEDDTMRTARALIRIYKMMFYRIPLAKRPEYISKLRGKLINLSPMEISQKKMKDSSVLGQALGFSKNILHGLDVDFIKRTLINVIYLLNRG